MSEIYLVKRFDAWLRAKACGYTSDVSEAGHYTKEHAECYLCLRGVTIHPVSEFASDLAKRRADILIALGHVDAMLASFKAD